MQKALTEHDTGCLARCLALPVEHDCLTAAPLGHSQEDPMQVHPSTAHLSTQSPHLMRLWGCPH